MAHDVCALTLSLSFPQHYARGFRGRPVLSGPVERGSGQAVQLWGPGHLDSNRCSSDRGRLCGTRRRLSVHLKRNPWSRGCVSAPFLPPLFTPLRPSKIEDPRYCELGTLRPPKLAAQHVLIPSAHWQEVLSLIPPTTKLPTRPIRSIPITDLRTRTRSLRHADVSVGSLSDILPPCRRLSLLPHCKVNVSMGWGSKW